MMKRALFLLAACLPVSAHSGHFEQGIEAYSQQDYKQAITHYERALHSAKGEERGLCHAHLAVAYYRDQNDIAAFKTFLKALDHPSAVKTVATDEEEALYKEALAAYFAQQHGAGKIEAVSLREKYLPITEAHPEYHKLAFLVAAANANIGLFDQFFEPFYSAYRVYPDHWLAHKIRALLHIKLMERLSDPEARAEQVTLARQQFIAALERGQEAGEVDTSLYKMLIASAPQEEKGEYVQRYMHAIVEGETAIPRRDIAYYVQEAVKVEAPELAEKLLERVKGWYEYSRSVEMAEQVLERYKQNKKDMG